MKKQVAKCIMEGYLVCKILNKVQKFTILLAIETCQWYI